MSFAEISRLEDEELISLGRRLGFAVFGTSLLLALRATEGGPGDAGGLWWFLQTGLPPAVAGFTIFFLAEHLREPADRSSVPRLLVLAFALGYIALAVKAADTRMPIGRAETGTWASLYVTSGALSSIALFWLLTVPSAGKHRLVVGVIAAMAVLIAGISLEVHEQSQRFFGLFWDVMATFPGVVSNSLLLVAAALYPRPLARLGPIVWLVAIALALARVVYPFKLAWEIPPMRYGAR